MAMREIKVSCAAAYRSLSVQIEVISSDSWPLFIKRLIAFLFSNSLMIRNRTSFSWKKMGFGENVRCFFLILLLTISKHWSRKQFIGNKPLTKSMLIIWRQWGSSGARPVSVHHQLHVIIVHFIMHARCYAWNPQLSLTHCGIMTFYGVMDLRHQWQR